MQVSVTGINDSSVEDSFFGNVVSRYSRAQAIADGVLIDVTKMAQLVAFAHPVAMTRAAWSDCVEWTDKDTRPQRFQSESLRLWDVMYMAKRVAKSTRGGLSPVALFPLWRVPRDGRGKRSRLKVLKMIVGPGDDAEPVITIMLPSED